jgi:signal transduction histidine kinase
VDNKIRDALFELSDLELLNAFAGQAAMAIENARLHTQTDKALAARVAEHAALVEENARLKAAASQARDSKSEFVRTVSHELKIPMTSIKGYTDLLKMVGQLNPQQEQFVGVIRANVDRMAVLVSDLADIARVDSGRLKVEIETVDLRDSVREALASLRGPLESKQQSVTQDFPPDLPRLRTDSMRLVQVLANLINNAHKYSPAGHGISVAATAEDGFVHVRVCDQGYGIAPADQARLFEQFFRSDEPAIREQPGWGLGLHLSKRLVELLGGEIRAESTPGEGSTFVFTVPAEN